MMFLKESFPNLVHCDWENIRGASLMDLISTDDGSNSGCSKFDPEEFISMERATQFAPKCDKDSENTHCYLIFNVQPTHHISHIRMTSESSKIEIFTGEDAQYLTVQFGQLLDKVEDTSVYFFEFRIPNAVEKVSLKFFLKQPLFWIIGLHLQLTQHNIPKLNIKPTINLPNVQAILDASNVQLTTSAEKCKQFLTMHMSNPSAAHGPPKFADMMDFVNQKASSVSSNSSQNINNSINSETPNNDGAVPRKESNISEHEQHSIQMVKAYFDLRMHEMEKRIVVEFKEHMRSVEERQNIKLDNILRKLEQLKSPINKFEHIELD